MPIGIVGKVGKIGQKWANGLKMGIILFPTPSRFQIYIFHQNRKGPNFLWKSGQVLLFQIIEVVIIYTRKTSLDDTTYKTLVKKAIDLGMAKDENDFFHANTDGC